ncbi:MAG: YchJ family metal-binding protein [Mycobacteriaceae bacterium]
MLPTPERLMGSGYTDFVRWDAKYLLSSWHPSARPQGLNFDPNLRRTGLTIVGTSGRSIVNSAEKRTSGSTWANYNYRVLWYFRTESGTKTTRRIAIQIRV